MGTAGYLFVKKQETIFSRIPFLYRAMIICSTKNKKKKYTEDLPHCKIFSFIQEDLTLKTPRKSASENLSVYVILANFSNQRQFLFNSSAHPWKLVLSL